VIASLWHAFPSARRKLFHTTGVDEHQIIEAGNEAVIVPPLADGTELEGTDVVVVTVAPAPAAATILLAWLRANPRAFLIDCSQPGLAPDACMPLLDAPPAGRREQRWFHLADPAIWPVGKVLTALAPASPAEAVVTVLLPASSFGADGVEELAKQAAARLSGRPTRRPETLREVLAFDAAPADSTRREALARQMRELFPQMETQLFAIDVGIFHGNAARLAVRTGAPVRQTEVAALIRSHPGLRLARRNERLQPSGAVGKAEVACSELDSDGHWIGVWLVADGLRVGGAQVVTDLVAAVTAC